MTTPAEPVTPPPSAPNTCKPDSPRGHYCRRNLDAVWVCIYCGWRKP